MEIGINNLKFLNISNDRFIKTYKLVKIKNNYYNYEEQHINYSILEFINKFKNKPIIKIKYSYYSILMPTFEFIFDSYKNTIYCIDFDYLIDDKEYFLKLIKENKINNIYDIIPIEFFNFIKSDESCLKEIINNEEEFLITKEFKNTDIYLKLKLDSIL